MKMKKTGLLLIGLAFIFGALTVNIYNSPEIRRNNESIEFYESSISKNEYIIRDRKASISKMEQEMSECYVLGLYDLCLEYIDLIEGSERLIKESEASIASLRNDIINLNRENDKIRKKGLPFIIMGVVSVIGGIILLIIGAIREKQEYYAYASVISQSSGISLSKESASSESGTNTWICPACGEHNPNSVRICRGCGKDK